MNTTPTQQQSNMWFAISLGLMGIIVGYAVASIPSSGSTQKEAAKVVSSRPTAPTPPAVPSAVTITPVDAATDHVRGDAGAKLTLITYSDYECPYSKRHHPTTTQLLTDYKGQLNLVYRHYPLSFHQNAQKKAEAAECVAELGGNEAFWKFTDAVYEKVTADGSPIAMTDLPTIVKDLGLDTAKFQSCLDSGKYTKQVQDEMVAGQKSGVTGTPGNILVNNTTKEAKTIPGGAKPIDTFKAVIDQELGS